MPLDLVMLKLKNFDFNNNDIELLLKILRIALMILIFNIDNNYEIDEYDIDFKKILEKIKTFFENYNNHKIDKTNTKEINDSIKNVLKFYS
jgi:hypothetical protein